MLMRDGISVSYVSITLCLLIGIWLRSQVETTANRKAEMGNELNTAQPQVMNPNGYSLMKEIGQGAFGKVYVGSKYDNRYAIKVIPDNLEKEKHDKLMNEVEILNTLSHPNIVKCTDSFFANANFYIVLEFCNAGDLNGFILNNKCNYLIKLSFAAQMMDALSYLYKFKIIHRDIKPDNIMICYVDNRYTIKIGDFGLARLCRNLTIEEPYYEFNYSPRAPCYYRPPESFDRIVTMDDYGKRIPQRVINGTVTITTDCFSFACLNMAMFSETVVTWVDGKLLLAPFVEDPPIEIARASPQQKLNYIRMYIKIPNQPVIEEEFQTLIFDMAKTCWRDRPNPEEARDRLQTLLQSLLQVNQAMMNYNQGGMNCSPQVNPAMMNYNQGGMNCSPQVNPAMMNFYQVPQAMVNFNQGWINCFSL